MPVKGSYLLLAGIGGVVVWSGVKGKGISSALRQVLQGKNPASATASNPIMGASYAYGYGSYAAEIAGATGAPAATGNAAQNQATAKVLALTYGWSTGQNWTDLVLLWDRESGWNQYADNPTSGAYGIPQALPPTKMPAGAQQSGGSSASLQIAWGLSYILGRYGSPTAAWAHEEQFGWY
jgi:hypothetical protein